MLPTQNHFLKGYKKIIINIGNWQDLLVYRNKQLMYLTSLVDLEYALCSLKLSQTEPQKVSCLNIYNFVKSREKSHHFFASVTE